MLSPEKAASYTSQFLILLLFFSVEKIGFALAVGLLVRLAYARRNLAVLAPLFIIAGAVFLTSWWTLLNLALPPMILSAVYFGFWKARRSVPTWMSCVSGGASILPYVVTEVVLGGEILPLAASCVIAVVFSLCCSIGSYAVIIRGIKCRFTLDEKIAGGLFAVAAAYSLYAADIYGFRLFWLVAPFILLLFADERRTVGALIASVILGLGAAINSSLEIVGAVIIAVSAALALKPFTRFASAVGMLAALAVLWWLNCTGIDWKVLVFAAAGVTVYCVLPSSFRKYFAEGGESAALNALVNRNRTELSARLSSLGGVFAEMSEGLASKQDEKGRYSAKRLASEVAKSYCGRCADRESCFTALGGDTSPVLEPMASAVLARGKTTILDIPTFITSRCNRMNNLTAVMNNAGEAYRRKIDCASENLAAKRLLSEQFAGLSLVLDALAEECGEHLTFGGNGELIENELLKHNIVARETVVVGESGSMRASVTVRDCDADKAVLPRIVSKCMKMRMAVGEVVPRGEEKVVHLIAAPLYEVAYGSAEKRRNGEELSGDVKSVSTPSADKRIFALCDGMGGGTAAANASLKTVRMVENFYRAGFDNALILSLVNKLLCLSDDEIFSAVDIAVVDTSSGGVDVIKLGAASGFLIGKDSISVIRSSLPPAGILEKVEPVTDRYQMYDGDMLLMASDGVVDALEERGVIETVEELSTSNPQSLADGLLLAALAAGATDDCTVMALRLVAV